MDGWMEIRLVFPLKVSDTLAFKHQEAGCFIVKGHKNTEQTQWCFYWTRGTLKSKAVEDLGALAGI